MIVQRDARLAVMPPAEELLLMADMSGLSGSRAGCAAENAELRTKGMIE
jgi:hypothetical protein